MRAHVKKEDGRMQAYGWSLPIHQANDPKSGHNSSPKSSLSFDPNFPVPIPVYCRPLMDKEPGMKVIKPFTIITVTISFTLEYHDCYVM